MVAGTVYLDQHEAQIIDILRSIISHGFGTMTIKITELRSEYKTKVVIEAGKSWMFVIEKLMPRVGGKEII